jgi:hypothetical protein
MIPYRTKIGVWFFIVFVLLFLMSVAVSIAHGTTSAPRPNSLGVQETYQNPNTYLLAFPLDGQILDGRFTNIRFAPYAAAVMFDQSILFCGDVTEQFEGKPGPLVVTYKTQASGMYRGVGCHELVSVFTVHSDQTTLEGK